MPLFPHPCAMVPSVGRRLLSHPTDLKADVSYLFMYVFPSITFLSSSQLYIVQGTEDITVNLKYAPLISSMLPSDTCARSKLMSVDSAGHDLTVSHCTLVTDLLMAFFEGKETKT